jgi:hypothetical protein
MLAPNRVERDQQRGFEQPLGRDERSTTLRIDPIERVRLGSKRVVGELLDRSEWMIQGGQEPRCRSRPTSSVGRWVVRACETTSRLELAYPRSLMGGLLTRREFQQPASSQAAGCASRSPVPTLDAVAFLTLLLADEVQRSVHQVVGWRRQRSGFEEAV